MFDQPAHTFAKPQQYYEWVARPKLASIVKIPPGTKGSDTYEGLICTESDKANIGEIVTILAENGKLSLLLKSSYLKQLGAQIAHVHPMKFLTTIFTNPQLKLGMNEIFDDYFKRNGFMDGLGPSLTKEADKNKLDRFLADFAKELGIALEPMKVYFQSRDWEGLVYFLMIQ
jgi:hypothetical protein